MVSPKNKSTAATQERAANAQAEVANATAPVNESAAEPAIDITSSEWYLNRELTWLSFNTRVLNEAQDTRVPLLERVKYLAIVAGNLDEFFMKRMGGLKQQIAAGVRTISVDGRTPEQQVNECYAETRRLWGDWERFYLGVTDELEKHDIRIVRVAGLNEEDRQSLRQQFRENIFPLLTPLAIDPGHPFPFISNLAINLLVTLKYPDGNSLHLARIKVPVREDVSPRFISLNGTRTYVSLDDLVHNNLDMLFPGMEIVSCNIFRVTRNANVEHDEEQADDLLEMIQSELRERHFAPIVRLEVMEDMDPVQRGMLAAELGLDEHKDVFESRQMLAARDLFEIAVIDEPDLHDKPHRGIEHPRLAHDKRNIFHIIRNTGPMLLQHPYESFSATVEHFLHAASHDPKVLAIKMTLYRTASKSRIIESLVAAARNGKQVAVLVELKAKFDEAANIRWARYLEEAGIHVTYGVVGLKTHTKILLVVRKDYNGLKRYAHIGTGNYHSGTARLYSDIGLLTDDPLIGQDLTELFNYLTGYSPPPRYRKVLAAPNTLKKSLLQKIEREIEHQKNGKHGLIQLKTNALEDQDVTAGLYKASQAGVKVDLIVRDTCRLRPGIKGLSESIRVVAIVGRFLEHTRVFYFRNAGDDEYYIGSADLMKRNLESRVELVTPVETPNLRQDLRMFLDAQLADRRSAWDMQSDGSYIQRVSDKAEDVQSSQEFFIRLADTRLTAAANHRQKKLRKKLESRYRRRLQREGF